MKYIGTLLKEAFSEKGILFIWDPDVRNYPIIGLEPPLSYTGASAFFSAMLTGFWFIVARAELIRRAPLKRFLSLRIKLANSLAFASDLSPHSNFLPLKDLGFAYTERTWLKKWAAEGEKNHLGEELRKVIAVLPPVHEVL